VRAGIRDTSFVFKQFKTGAKELAYPLARGIAEVLRDRDLQAADFIVPIPLSPDKATAGELHRTLALANELSQLLGIAVRQSLYLDRPISKRALGLPAETFERRYAAALGCSGMRPRPRRVLLVDDVCTHGSTLRVAARAIQDRFDECEVVACTAGQMTVREALADPDRLLEAE
jgi:predicted amidophosphoribosyltransferase